MEGRVVSFARKEIYECCMKVNAKNSESCERQDPTAKTWDKIRPTRVPPKAPAGHVLEQQESEGRIC